MHRLRMQEMGHQTSKRSRLNSWPKQPLCLHQPLPTRRCGCGQRERSLTGLSQPRQAPSKKRKRQRWRRRRARSQLLLPPCPFPDGLDHCSLPEGEEGPAPSSYSSPQLPCAGILRPSGWRPAREPSPRRNLIPSPLRGSGPRDLRLGQVCPRRLQPSPRSRVVVLSVGNGGAGDLRPCQTHLQRHGASLRCP